MSGRVSEDPDVRIGLGLMKGDWPPFFFLVFFAGVFSELMEFKVSFSFPEPVSGLSRRRTGTWVFHVLWVKSVSRDSILN